jgi:uncharacterized protein YukE
VGVLDAFMSTWSSVRATFGQGTPRDGSAFDASKQLRRLQTSVESAAPGDRWRGSAADAYAEANRKQGNTLGQMADLDRRLGAEVDRSAAVVAAGRRNLDEVKQWVTDAASSVPPGANREQALMPIARKGIGEVADILKQSNSDLNAIGGRIRAIGHEYQELGGPKKSPPTTTSPTPEPPQCKPEDQAKLIQKIDEWNRRDKELTREISDYNRKYPPGHPFDIRDPVQRAEWERGQKLDRDRIKLMRDFGQLIIDIQKCGGKVDEKTGDILWPDGSKSHLGPTN